MDFGLSQTQTLFRDEIREFVDERIIGENLAWDDRENFPRGVVSDLAEIGVLGMNNPEEAGGAGLTPLTAGVVYEELGRGDVALTMLLMVQNLANRVLYEHGTPEQRAVAKENMRGEVFLSWGLTEPDHGADARAIETRVEPDGDDLVVRGQKTAITGITFADHVLTYARNSDTGGIRAYLVPLDHDDIDVQPYRGIGGRVSGWGEVFFDGARIPVSAQVGEGDGFKMAMDRFDPSRAWIPLYCLGAAQQTIDETVAYLTDREAFGKSVAAFQGPQFEVADMRARVETARLKAYEALWRATANEPFTADASMAKLIGTRVSQEVIHDCMILHGHYGYAEETGIARRMQDVIGLEIGEGPHQIQKLIIARETFGREYLPY